ncbi:methyl-accepting chemotaxis protein [Parasalinivibrio latis]|uniref:methyl-accepting chemotaxis protein n=1 Tax=Parasalinivibrio latis TaxID=2952610 RepID=UPI0030E109D1
MSKMVFRPWERIISDVRLLPKMIMLMVFSTVLLVGKQLWDAHTFRDSVVDILLHQNAETASATGKILETVSKEANSGELALSVLKAQGQALGAETYLYVVDTKTGKVMGHPTAKSVKDINLKTDSGVMLPGMFQNGQGIKYSLDNGARIGTGVAVGGTPWVAVVSQDTAEAQDFYNAYLVKIAWQTGLIIVAFMVVLLGASRVMLRQTQYISDSVKRLAERDLSVEVDMDCKDEYGDIAREIERARLRLLDVVKMQRDSSAELGGHSEIMTISMEETRESAKEQFKEIDQLASAMSEMSSTVQNVAEHARTASAATEGSKQQAERGQGFVSSTISTINQLSSDIRESAEAVNQVDASVDKISSVIVTIQGISEQTNLLALNAAIEAARAGEAGRGFAVVADEVRNLAQNTQKATVEIQEMISQLQQNARSAVSLMEQSVVEAADSVESVSNAGEELEKIVHDIDQVNDMNFHIASAAEQQAQVANEMNANLSNVRELVEASVTVVTELAETAELIQKSAEDLDGKVKAFVV